MSSDPRGWKPLPPILRAAVTAFNDWCQQYLSAADILNKITTPLYHYTDAQGLEAIIKSQQIWFTSHTHLNDPSEIQYGMTVASELLDEIGQASDPRIKLFCDMVIDLFTHKNMSSSFGVYIASFSRKRDDLGQWRAYADNGHGFALGLAPHLFHAVDKADLTRHHKNVFVTPVVYGKDAGRRHHLPPIQKAVRVVADAVQQAAPLMQDSCIGMPFFDEMAKSLIAGALLINSLTVKHKAYQHESEVRLFIVGEHENLRPHIATRPRRGDVVPFIKKDMPIQTKESIIEIVVGPSAADSAEEGVRKLLTPFHDSPASIVRRSTIPYRAP